MRRKELRNGFTTGSAAAAGTKAALMFLAGRLELGAVDIPLPAGGRMSVPVAKIETLSRGVRATVVKDGGDDPDATHKASIRSTVRLLKRRGQRVRISGGKGVGRVTRPGLPVPVGRAAINPAPYQQIEASAREVLTQARIENDVSVVIDVVNGEKIALKTLNPRLGIVGGISILGTRGTVKPFSNAAYRDTITMSMDVAKAEGSSVIALSTGGRSERFIRRQRPDLAETACVQVADFFSFSLKEAAKREFSDILYSCFFGKLVKMAQGAAYTHAAKSKIDFGLLSEWCTYAGIEQDAVRKILRANTAREALEYIVDDHQMDEAIGLIVDKALQSARGFLGPCPRIIYYVFDFNGRLIARKEDQKGIET